MVSGTRCPAGSDHVKYWGESRAAAPKGRCPVEHRGEFPYVRPSFRPSVHPSLGLQGPDLDLLRTKLGTVGQNQASLGQNQASLG